MSGFSKAPNANPFFPVIAVVPTHPNANPLSSPLIPLLSAADSIIKARYLENIAAWHLSVGISGDTMRNPHGPSEWQGTGVVPVWPLRPVPWDSRCGIPIPSFYTLAKGSAAPGDLGWLRPWSQRMACIHGPKPVGKAPKRLLKRDFRRAQPRVSEYRIGWRRFPYWQRRFDRQDRGELGSRFPVLGITATSAFRQARGAPR